MEKILLVINAHRPDIASIDFACHIAAIAKSRLTGLFIENIFEWRKPLVFEQVPYFDAVLQQEGGTVTLTGTEMAVKVFVEQCAINGVPSETYIDKGEPIQEVIAESRFADLLILDPKINFYSAAEQVPSHFAREIMARAECPLLLAPEQFQQIDEIVFCYDGSASSVFAIKQFTYILPQMKTCKAVLLEVNKSGNENVSEGHRRIMEWMQVHYSAATYQSVKGTAKDELFNFFFKKSNKLVVLGAYGRGQLSNFFRHSTADVLIRTIDLPLFITHH